MPDNPTFIVDASIIAPDAPIRCSGNAHVVPGDNGFRCDCGKWIYFTEMD